MGPSAEVGPWGYRWSEAESGEEHGGPPSRRQSGPCTCLGCPGACCPWAFLGWGATAGVWCPRLAAAPGQSRFLWGKGRVQGLGKEDQCGECAVWGCSPARVDRFTFKAAKALSLSCMGCCRQLSGVCFFQNIKIQRSVGRAKDGTTFPLSLKLKSEPRSEMAEAGTAVPEQGYSASVWVFSTISGLITLLPDGTVYGINHNFALMLFGYGKTELLGKVGPPWAASLPAPAGGWSGFTVRTRACHRLVPPCLLGRPPGCPWGTRVPCVPAPCLHSFLRTPRRVLCESQAISRALSRGAAPGEGGAVAWRPARRCRACVPAVGICSRRQRWACLCLLCPGGQSAGNGLAVRVRGKCS